MTLLFSPVPDGRCSKNILSFLIVVIVPVHSQLELDSIENERVLEILLSETSDHVTAWIGHVTVHMRALVFKQQEDGGMVWRWWYCCRVRAED